MKKILAFILTSSSLFTSAQSINESHVVFEDRNFHSQIKKGRDSIQALMLTKKIPGFSICVSKKGKIIWAEGFGYNDLENKIPVRINTKFRIGSVSKSLTAVGLARMLQNKKMNLDSPVTSYVSYFPQKRIAFTIHQLASHTAGIRHYNPFNGEFLSTKKYNSVKESVDIFKDDTLLFQPGTKHYYSSYGYNLLSAAMEGAARMPFLQYMHTEVFAQLKMHNTVPDHNDSIIQNRSNFYELKNNATVNATYVDNSNKWAGGGFLSAPVDLVKLGNALLQKQFISPGVLNQLWTPYVLSSGAKNIYGLGFRIEKDAAGRTMIHHGGASVGGGAFLIMYPDQELVVAIAYNLLPQSLNRGALAEIFLNEIKPKKN